MKLWSYDRRVIQLKIIQDVADSDSESDGIRHFFINPKSDGYLKSDHVGFAIFLPLWLLQQK